MEAKENTILTEIYSGTPWEAELIKGLLESNGIESVLKDGIMGTLAPYLSTEVAILVNEKDYELSMQIIRERDNGNDA